MSTATTYKLKQPIPALPSKDLEAATKFYVEKLGFEKPWVHNGEYGGVEKDGCFIHFYKSETPGSATVYQLPAILADSRALSFPSPATAVALAPESTEPGEPGFQIFEPCLLSCPQIPSGGIPQAECARIFHSVGSRRE